MTGSAGPSGIVVGVDGSPASKAALCWAARTAALRGVELLLVHAIPDADSAWPELPLGFEPWRRQQAQDMLDEAREVVAQCAPPDRRPPLRTQSIASGVLPAMVELSQQAALMVVGNRGRGTVGRMLLGSVSMGLVHRAHCPVAVIRDEDPLMAHPAQAPVVVGVDGTPASEAAIELAFEEASLRGVQLIALHAWSDARASEVPGLDWDALQPQAQELLAQRLAGWQERYPDLVVRREVVCDEPTRRLLEQSESAQLVVVGSRGRGGFAGMFLGSVSSAVVQSARMPVIVARGQ